MLVIASGNSKALKVPLSGASNVVFSSTSFNFSMSFCLKAITIYAVCELWVQSTERSSFPTRISPVISRCGSDLNSSF